MARRARRTSRRPRRTSRKKHRTSRRLQPNIAWDQLSVPAPPVPPRAAGGARVYTIPARKKMEAWLRRTLAPGTPVKLIHSHGWKIDGQNVHVPPGARAVVTDPIRHLYDEFWVPIEVTDARSARYALPGVVGYRTEVSVDGVEPLVDNWVSAAGAQPIPRHRLPGSQRSPLKPNASKDDEVIGRSQEYQEEFDEAMWVDGGVWTDKACEAGAEVLREWTRWGEQLEKTGLLSGDTLEKMSFQMQRMIRRWQERCKERVPAIEANKRRTSRNPTIPSPPQRGPGGGAAASRYEQKLLSWAKRSFPVGTSVMFTRDHEVPYPPAGGALAKQSATVGKGAKGEVVQWDGRSALVMLYPSAFGTTDPAISEWERYHEEHGVALKDALIWLHIAELARGTVVPVGHSWGSTSQPTPRYLLPRSQQKRVKSNRRRTSRNPIPPAPDASNRRAYLHWAFRTFDVGTPVALLSGWVASAPDPSRGYVGHRLPAGTRGEVYDINAVSDGVVSVQVRFPWKPGGGGSTDGWFDAGTLANLKPLTDNWGPAPKPLSRHQLPRSQSSWLKPNRRRTSRRPRPNPIPPPPQAPPPGTHGNVLGMYEHRLWHWFLRTFPVGASIEWKKDQAWSPGGGINVTLPRGIKAEVISHDPTQYGGDPNDRWIVARFLKVIPGVSDPRIEAFAADLEQRTGKPLHELDFGLEPKDAADGIVWPLTDTWGATPGAHGRHGLPRSQRSWLKPNPKIVGPAAAEAAANPAED